MTTAKTGSAEEKPICQICGSDLTDVEKYAVVKTKAWKNLTLNVCSLGDTRPCLTALVRWYSIRGEGSLVPAGGTG